MTKKIYKNQSGLSSMLMVVIVAALVVGGYSVYKWSFGPKPSDINMESDEMMEDTTMKDGMMQEGDNSGMMMHSGKLLAGKSSFLLEYNKTDFDTALKSDKLVVLYFYANWCPICRAEFPKMQEAFNELTTDRVVGFQVNYNDDQTDNNEKELAREHGVAYQHTKVLIKNGQRIGKYPDSWDKSRYLSEINKAVEQ